MRRSRGFASLLALAAWMFFAGSTASAQAKSTIVDGAARFEVITPSLIRLEYAADGRFENRLTLTTEGRLGGRSARVRTKVRSGNRIIRTSRLTLSWRRGSGPFGAGSLRVRIGNRKLAPRPGANPAPLGGWRRSLDLVDGPVPLHEGMLSRAGWYLLDDTKTALVQGDDFQARPDHEGAYQDFYLFAYGSDYVRGLRDLRTLTGPAPLLPRKAFGVWFSRWWPYGDSDWRALVERFREEQVPLDTISIDTDFKAISDPVFSQVAAQGVGSPNGIYSWNAWDWNRELYPDPPGFLDWARSAGLEVGLNVHPSISSADPRFGQAQATAGGTLAADPDCKVVQADSAGDCMVFDWTDPKQLEAYFGLHKPFEADGPVFWWLDWCCDGSSAKAPGLTADTWINRAYYRNQRDRGIRWPAFSRIGGSLQGGIEGTAAPGAFAEHRQTIQFTGDTCASWKLLAFASEFTASAASIGEPYVSHDIGTFHAVSPTGTCDADLSPVLTPRQNDLPSDMYVRWVQLGTFQPIDRLHSHHGRRLPWEYPPEIESIASKFLRLREQLGPYLYTLGYEAHRTGVPMVRPLYLQWPDRDDAYRHPSEYTLGRDVLVAPVAKPGESPVSTVWFPPGTWVNWFTGERHQGPATEELEVPLNRMPVFARAGSIVPTQHDVLTTPEGPPRSLVLLAQAGSGKASLYDDSGIGFAYERGKYTRTMIKQHRSRGTTDLTISPARGGFASAPHRRSYEIRLAGVPRPTKVVVADRRIKTWRYLPETHTAIIQTDSHPTSQRLRIEVG